MKNTKFTLFLSVFLAFSPPLFAADDTAEPDSKYTWDLSDLYSDVATWDQARSKILGSIDAINARKGTLGKSADSLYQALQLISDTNREATRIYIYASLNADEDLRISETQERRQLVQTMAAKLGEATAWVNPEILRIGDQKIRKFIKADKRLAPFAFGLEDTLRNADHTLGDEAEHTLSYFSESLDAPSNIYSLVANSDIPWPMVKMSDGKEYRIDAQGYGRWRGSDNRDDRKKAFDAYWNTWKSYRNSVGMILSSYFQGQVAMAKARKFDSVLQRELFDDNLPEDVYRTLVTEVNRGLPTLHRYFKLRARMLGVDQLRYYDIYPPLVSMDKTFDIETTRETTLAAMAPLGSDWVDIQREAMSKRWMHVYPQQGKQSGAYQTSSYDTHPYLLLNHNDDYESLSTYAHEWGHAMHTLYAGKAQPFETADYATFIAEIPSTTLEMILQEYMVAHAQSVDEKLYYIGSGLERLRGTFFRQTMFAEFELALYEAIERGEAMSGESISKMYGDIQKRYHGSDEGVVEIDDLYTNEWMFIPHFYMNMYVFQYATSQTAGTALFDRIKKEGAAGADNFKNLLKSGGSDYPYTLLRKAGVDMATPEPYRAVVTHMNKMLDEMEALLVEKGR